MKHIISKLITIAITIAITLGCLAITASADQTPTPAPGGPARRTTVNKAGKIVKIPCQAVANGHTTIVDTDCIEEVEIPPVDPIDEIPPIDEITTTTVVEQEQETTQVESQTEQQTSCPACDWCSLATRAVEALESIARSQATIADATK